MTSITQDSLVLGPDAPLRRRDVGDRLVRTADAARVTVTRAGGSWSAPTFSVHDEHVALVVLEDWTRAARTSTP
jgi:hypothetical protein